MPTIYVSARLGRAADIARQLEEAGCRVRRGPTPGDPAAVTRFAPEEVERWFGDVDAIVVGTGEVISPDVIAGARRMTTVCCFYIGTEFIDLDACTAAGVLVGYGAVPDNYLGVAEAVVMLATALLKELPAKQRALVVGGWGVPEAGRMVAGSTFGMIGFGNVGRAVARRLAGWDVRLLCHDPYVSPADAGAAGVRLVDLDALLRAADVVSVQASLTPATQHLIGARELALMRPDAYLVNTARGPLVDEAALRDALDRGLIAGAALDVWEEEPTPAGNPLRRHPRVIATGHNVGHPQRLYEDMVAAAVENVLRPLRGEPPRYLRNPAALPAWAARRAARAGA